MFKLLIVTSDLLLSKELINQVIGKLPNLQIIGIVTTRAELRNFRKNTEFDYVLFHNCMSYNWNSDEHGIIIIDEFKTPLKKYDNKITLSNSSSLEFILKQIEIFTQVTSIEHIREQAVETLLKLGFTFKHIGTKYLVDAICYSYTHRHSDSFENLEKEIYPYIAKVNNTQVQNVKWSVARTINLMYLNHTTKSILVLENYFNLDHMQKPTPKLVIGMVSNRIISNLH